MWRVSGVGAGEGVRTFCVVIVSVMCCIIGWRGTRLSGSCSSSLQSWIGDWLQVVGTVIVKVVMLSCVKHNLCDGC